MNKGYGPAEKALDGLFRKGAPIASGGFGLFAISEIPDDAIFKGDVIDVAIASKNCCADRFDICAATKEATR